MNEVVRNTGLLPIFGWLVGDNLLDTFIRCLLVTPGGVIIIGLLLEGRLIPFSPKKQYLSFIPGDFFLSAFCSLLIWMPLKTAISRDAWYTQRWWHLLVLLICISGAFEMHFKLEAKAYTSRSLNSPTKLYHDIALYGAYNYVMWGGGLPKLLSGNLSGIRLLVFAPLLIWLILVIIDTTLVELADKKREFAHPMNWQFPWKR